MLYLNHRLRTLIAGVAAILVATLTFGVSPASAQEDSGGDIAPPACDVELDSKLVMIPAVWPDGRIVPRHESEVIPLAQPLSGTVVSSGITGDLQHFDDFIDGTFRLTQFEEQVAVQFLDANGDVIAETDPTPDLPDFAPYAPFNLPSVHLDSPAVAVKIVHAGVTPDEPNSIAVPCVNFKMLDEHSSPSDYLEFNVCPVDASVPFEAFCGFLSVPEDRQIEGSRLISVAFAIVPGDGTKPDPLVYLEGGPGGAPMANSGLIHDFAIGAAADGRDVIYFDQRGTGYADPNLNCATERDFAAPPEFFETEEEFLAAQDEFLAGCFARFDDEGVYLSGYTTVENAEDVADLRIALGVEEWNLFGGSYGTDLGLTIMRDRPEGVRSVVLDSVFPPEVSVGGGEDGIGFLNRLERIVDYCNSTECGAAFPNLQSDINVGVDNLNANPAFVTGTEAELLFGIPDFPVDGNLLLQIASFDLPNPYLPALFNAAASDDPAVRQAGVDSFMRATSFYIFGLDAPQQETVLADFRGIPGPAAQFSDGFFFTVMCAEETPYTDLATMASAEWSEAITGFAATIIGPQIVSACNVIGTEVDIQPEVPAVGEPVFSDIDSLVIYTDNDNQTPPEWSELTASRLTNVDLVFFPNLAHVVAFSGPCPQSVVSQFLNNPGGELDLSCIDELPVITYAVELPEIDPLPPIDEFFALLDQLFAEQFPPPEGEEPPAGEPAVEEAPPGDEVGDPPAEAVEESSPA